MNLLAFANQLATLAMLAIPKNVVATAKEEAYPKLANEVIITGHATAWVTGPYSTLIADVGALDFVVTGVYVVAITGIHQLQMAYGASSSEVRINTIPLSAVGYHRITPFRVEKNSRISCRTASKAGGAQTVAIFLTGYPIIA